MKLDSSAKRLFKVTALIVAGITIPTQILYVNNTFSSFIIPPLYMIVWMLPFAVAYSILLRMEYLNAEKKRTNQDKLDENFHKNDIKFQLRYQASEIEGHEGTRWELTNIGNMPWKQGILLLERMDNYNLKRVERHPLPTLLPKEKAILYSHIEPLPRARWKGMVLTTHGYGVDLGERWEEHGWLNQIAAMQEKILRQALKKQGL